MLWFLLCAALPERAVVLAREGDAWALTAAQHLEGVSSGVVAIEALAPLLLGAQDGVTLVPVFSDTSPAHQAKELRAAVQDAIVRARTNTSHAKAILEEALALAIRMPANEPERRGAAIRQVIRELLSVIMREEGRTARADALLDELVLREAGGPITSDNKPLLLAYQRRVADAQSVPRRRLHVKTRVPAVSISLDGADGAMYGPDPTLVVREAWHEITLSQALPLWVRRVRVAENDVTLSYDAELEQAIALTPDGVWLRKAAELTPVVAAQLAERLRVSVVLFVEKIDPSSRDALVRAYRRESLTTARMRWEGEPSQISPELVIAASDAAVSGHPPLSLRNYEVRMGAPRELLFTPYAGEWRPAAPWFKSWWFWSIVGGVTAVGLTTAVVLGAQGDGKVGFQPTVTFPP